LVKEFQHCRSQDLLLAVDLWLPSPPLRKPQPADFERVELAVSFAASICVDHMQSASDSIVELVISGRDTQGASAGSGVASMGGLLERLALAQAGPADDTALAVRQAANSAAGQLRQVLITTRPRAAVEAALAAQDDADESFDASGLEIIEADPTGLTAWLEFDLSEPGGVA
jgi:uncharacterized protein (DUF58 family)